MKAFKYLVGALALSALFVACEKDPVDNGGDKKPGDNDTTVVPTPKPGEMPEVAAVEGKVVVVLNVAETADACNDIIFIGDYNKYNTSPETAVYFEEIEGYDRWYKVEIAQFDNPDDDNTWLQGKAIQLKDGKGAWDYQWFGFLDDSGKELTTEVEILKGDAEWEFEYGTQQKLKVKKGCDVVYVKTPSWQNNPCVEPDKYTITFTAVLPAALTDTCTLEIYGDLKGEGWNGYVMEPNADRTEWTASFDELPYGKEYKYRAVGVATKVAHWELGAKEEGQDCAKGIDGNRKINDVDQYDDILNIADLTIDECKEEEKPAE